METENLIRADIDFTVYTSILFDKSKLTKELMDNYEKYFYNLNEDSMFDRFDTQIEKHMANIAKYVALGIIEHIEGYGDIKQIIKSGDDIEDIEIDNYDFLTPQQQGENND